MSTVLHPVGPQRARVYWVRRLLVVLVVVALVALTTTVVSWLRGAERSAPAAAAVPAAQPPAGGASDDGTSDDEAPSDEGSDDEGSGDSGGDAAGEEEAAPSTPVDCTPESLRLTLTGADVRFGPGVDPVLTATVTNVGDEPCTVDAGDATREVVVTSGDDRVWSTKDCASEESASRQLLLGAGAADAVEIEWPRIRSAEGCPADLPAPGPGTYQAVATLDGISSQTVVFLLE